MNKQDLIAKLEALAPLETQEKWDCSGWLVEHSELPEVKKVMFALTVTKDVFNQAIHTNCDLIIAHHPLFAVPLEYKQIQIYCAHTNVDKALGGTTDTILETLGFTASRIENDFVRVVEPQNPIQLEELIKKLQTISPKLRYVNNNNVQEVKTIGFCAGSGSEFIDCTYVDCFVTGDLKYHTACEADKVIFDIGHFESEVLIKEKFAKILMVDSECEWVMADEKSPFI